MNILSKLINGLAWAVPLNWKACRLRIQEEKTVIVCIFNTDSQFMHLSSVIIALQNSKDLDIEFIFLVNPGSIHSLKSLVHRKNITGTVGSIYATKFLLCWHLVLTVVQSAQLPFFKTGKTICIFHGQPSKGNVYEGFNYRSIDALFCYGPMMEEYYLEQKASHPEWPDIKTYRIGQPKTDPIFSDDTSRTQIRQELGVPADKPCIIYAPSFEYCSSLFQNGDLIISTLLEMDIFLLIKPHPAIYNPSKQNMSWLQKLVKYGKESNCLFIENPDTARVVKACDIMVTDYSGVAFDAILLDKPVIYWDCPLFFSEYLPEVYGLDADVAVNELYANVGRKSGIVVTTAEKLKKAVRAFIEDASLFSDKRKALAKHLLYNKGKATSVATNTIIDILKNGHGNG
jgi:hypothetical protein